jgi:hypothetical protein
MPKYNVDKAFWRKGLEVKAGGNVTLTETEAKYLGHVVSAYKPDQAVNPAVPAPAPVEEAVAPAPATVAVVEEQPARHAKRKRHDDSAH